MSTTPVPEPSEQPGWIKRGWEDDEDSERAPVLGVAVLVTFILVTCVSVLFAIWLQVIGHGG
jgi:hypothetical protein